MIKYLALPMAFAFAVTSATLGALGQETISAEADLSEGIVAFMHDDLPLARKFFEAAIGADPNLAAAHYFRGLTLLQQAIRDPANRQSLSEAALAEFELTRVHDPRMVLAALDAARAKLVLQRFEAAQSGFQEYVDQRPDDPIPYLFLAITAYQSEPGEPAAALKWLDQAEEALRQSQTVNPAIESEIELYRGLAKRRTEIQAARAHLERAVAIAPDSKAASAAQQHLQAMERDFAARRPWDLTLQLGLEWDSNVVLRGENTLGVDTDDSDWRLGFSSDFSYRLVDEKDWVVGAGLATFDSWHADIDEFDVQNYGGNLYASFIPPGQSLLMLGLRYDGDTSLLDNQTFLNRHRLTPQVDLFLSERATTTLFYQLDLRDYRFNSEDLGSDPRFNRDGLTNALGGVQSLELVKMGKHYLDLTLAYRFEHVRTDGSQFDADNHVLTWGLDVPLPEDFTLSYLNEWELQYYDHGNLLDHDRSDRRDVIATYAIGLTKKFNESLSARLSVVYTEDDSNVRDRYGQEPFSYERIVYGLTIAYRF